MRISTNSMYQSNVNQLSDIQNQLSNLYTQVSTGKRVNTPADDPVAAAQIMNLTAAQQQNTDYTNTGNTANTYLQTYESNLSSVSNTVLSIQSSLVSAGNGTLSNTDRANLATTLQGQMQTLLGFANATDSQGNYLYSGSKVGTAAFDSSGNYQGDTNNLNLQVSPSTQMAVTYNGQQVFSTNGTSIFTTIQNAINLLNTPVTDSTTQSNLTSGMSTAISQVQDYLNQVQTTSADVGGKINQLSALNTTATNVNLQYTNSISNLQDLNYTQAISDLTKNQTILQAAQKSFVSTSQLSLFQYIS